MMLESYSITGISIIQDVPRGSCLGGFTRFLCSEKDWRIMHLLWISWWEPRNYGI